MTTTATTTDIQVWETEDCALVVWGTHDVWTAYLASYDYYENVVGDIPEGLLHELFMSKVLGHGQFWGDPDLVKVDDEYWPNTHWSKEPVEVWVPYLVVSW